MKCMCVCVCTFPPMNLCRDKLHLCWTNWNWGHQQVVQQPYKRGYKDKGELEAPHLQTYVQDLIVRIMKSLLCLQFIIITNVLLLVVVLVLSSSICYMVILKVLGLCILSLNIFTCLNSISLIVEQITLYCPQLTCYISMTAGC